MLEIGNSSPPLTTTSTASAEASTVSSSENQAADDRHQQQLPSQPALKKKRNQPGMPDPEAEVVALSPQSLLATNRFVCEICGKGFQRDQNLQLHRRGHNLPWKLKQRGTKEVRRRVYVCPETSCVHHDPKRALGDLTGIKKHFSRKHGEKKWKCERCCKKYAVQSDWKAHMKTCGTKEYKCDCGTVFSRRDSFVTHRAFCDALAQESVKVQVEVKGEIFPGGGEHIHEKTNNTAEATPVTAPSSSGLSPVLSIQSSEAPETSNTHNLATASDGDPASSSAVNSNNVVFGSIFSPLSGLHQPQVSQFSPLEQPSLSLSSLYHFPQNSPSLFHHQQFPQPPPSMSATALLQQAAQMGSASSLLWGFGLPSSTVQIGDASQGSMKNDNGGGGLGHAFLGSGSIMNGPNGVFAGRPTTLDLLGLGVRPNDSSPNGLSSLLAPYNDGLDLGSFGGGNSWEIYESGRKPNHTLP